MHLNAKRIIFRVNRGHELPQIAQDSNFAHHLQLHNRVGINLIVQLRVLNKSVLILYECKDLSFVKTLKLVPYQNQIK